MTKIELIASVLTILVQISSYFSLITPFFHKLGLDLPQIKFPHIPKNSPTPDANQAVSISSLITLFPCLPTPAPTFRSTKDPGWKQTLNHPILTMFQMSNSKPSQSSPPHHISLLN